MDSLLKNKAPGPDGIPTEFFQEFWEEIGESVMKYFRIARAGHFG